MLSVSVSASAGWRSRLGELGQLRDRQRAFEQRIGGMHVQMHEAGICGHGGLSDLVADDGGDGRLPCPQHPEPCPLSSGPEPTACPVDGDALQRADVSTAGSR